MECEAFFAVVDDALGDRWVRPRRTAVSHQCVVDFFHPRTVAALGDDGVATAFNRSGCVWAPPARRLGVELRVPVEHDAAVRDALAAVPFPIDRTDHRGVTGPGGTTVSLVHYNVRATDVDDDALAATLRAVADALAV